MEQQEKSKAIIAAGSVTAPVDETRKANFTGNSPTTSSRSLARLFAAEWDAITGLAAAAIVLTLHWTHVAEATLLLPIAVGLIALLFIRSLRQERRTEQAFDEVHGSLALLQDVEKKLGEQESIINNVQAVANANLSLLRRIEEKQVTPQHLKTHNLCLQIGQIEKNLGNSLFDAKWEETLESIDNLAQGRIIVLNRSDIFTYKAKALKALNKDEWFYSTVIPADLDYPTYEDDHFERYQEEIFAHAARVRDSRGRVKRLYIFRDQEQYGVLSHQKHMQEMADHDVEVGYLILSNNIENKTRRDLIAHKDYAIFGAHSYARYDNDKHRSVIETDQHRINEAINDFQSLWNLVGNQMFYRRDTRT